MAAGGTKGRKKQTKKNATCEGKDADELSLKATPTAPASVTATRQSGTLPQQSGSQQLPDIQSTPDCASSRPPDDHTAASDSGSLCHPCCNEIINLHAIIQQQQATIDELRCQLNSVLSFLGIADHEFHDKFQDTTPASQICTDNLPAAPDKITEPPPANKQPLHQRTLNFQKSIVAAVYVDQAERKRRESSFIISGLDISQSDDQKLVADHCHTEFDIHPEIVSTRRLGKKMAGKAQPLLVTLRQAAQAQLLISNAKCLRRSSNPVIRERVFINRNLTKAEAEAEYQVRQQRRRTATLRNTDAQRSIIHSDVSNSLSLLSTACNPTSLFKPPNGARPPATHQVTTLMPAVQTNLAAGIPLPQNQQQGRLGT